MASKTKDGKPLVIVESPAKARTISKFLGKDYVIEASVGHVRDLPANATEVPAAIKKEAWGRLGINVEDGFKPVYVVPKDKREHLRRLKKLVKEASVLYLATDEDREGESISWHLLEELSPKTEVRRLVFHEITKDAIHHALANPREIDMALVEAQETRRIVDRLYGYEVSPLLWKKIKPRLSAGRVQSVAVRLVVERERERIRFKAADYWDLIGRFAPQGLDPFDATLASLSGQRIASGKDFDPDTGTLKGGSNPPLHLTESAARALAARLDGQPAVVESLEQKPFTERPKAPFTTSTLQQAAGNQLKFTAKRTMRAAQRLYENGYITYMRTDSTTLSGEAIGAARRLIASEYGDKHVPEKPRFYANKVKNAQEAHEAIRPAGSHFTHPRALGADMGEDERRVYELIWKRTVACQMKDALGQRTTLTLAIDDARFTVSGQTIQYPGFRLAYAERNDDSADTDRLLPDVKEGQSIPVDALDPDGHTTKPPARLTEATLIRSLEEKGIGRPSTYASIIDTILTREYCFKKGAAMVPTFTAFAVVRLLDQYLTSLVDYAFTAQMESDLDAISNGQKTGLDYLQHFYNGNGHPGLRGQLTDVETKIDPRDVCTVQDFALEPFEGEPIEVRVGRYGPFLSAGGVTASLPDETAPDELTNEFVQDLLAKSAAGPKSLGSHPETGLKVYVKVGRFGPYVQHGDPEELDGEKPKMASLLSGMDPETITLDTALALLSLPREIGEITLAEHEAQAGETHMVKAANGRFGPYLMCGKSTRSIPADESPLTITLAQAKELCDQPKQRRGARAAPTALKELGKHPTTEREIKLFEGRYGPYLSDGETNATVPKDEKPEGISLARAVELIDARAAMGGGKKKRGAKKATAKKKATKKKTTTKKATAKKAD
ncbi:MAG: type I DNA topoisomerase [Gaiellales bacterium]